MQTIMKIYITHTCTNLIRPLKVGVFIFPHQNTSIKKWYIYFLINCAPGWEEVEEPKLTSVLKIYQVNNACAPICTCIFFMKAWRLINQIDSTLPLSPLSLNRKWKITKKIFWSTVCKNLIYIVNNVLVCTFSLKQDTGMHLFYRWLSTFQLAYAWWKYCFSITSWYFVNL